MEEKEMKKRNSNLSWFKWYVETNKNKATLLFQTNKQDNIKHEIMYCLFKHI